MRTLRDERGSLPVALLVTMVGVLLSTLLVSTVIAQNTNTRTQIARVAALNAAQTGLDVALAHIRASTDSDGDGVLSKLPCVNLSGAVAAVAGGTRSTYKVTIDYYPVDPQNRSDAWLAANTIRCIIGAGAFSTPGYALLRSTGTYTPNTANTAPTTVRTLQGTYTFQTSDENISGGLIHVYKTSTTTDLCFDAGSGSPTAGTPLTMKPCSAGSVAQTWTYNANLTLSLVSSKTPTMSLGMCLDAGTSPKAGAIVYLQPCAKTTSPQQQWSYNDSANFEGTSNGSTLNGTCFNVQQPNVAGSFVILGSGANCRKSYNNVQNFFPEATAGAGAAGAAAGQLVNFEQFGRCLDVTGQKTDADFLISWQCKQAPNPANVAWNQKWTTPTLADGTAGVKSLVTTNRSGLYCLRSPRSAARGQYVRIVSCSASSTSLELLWTFYGNTGAYATSYTVVDSSGYCLSPTDPDAASPDLYSTGQSISKIVVAVCDGSTLQKWNAPTSILQALPLKDIKES
ncbi:RICIN domain-containing protein [Cryptosporangium aurantiacum]|uniref:Ricin-type beta-trefoil lectin domain-containing protein n=1 Tax=Cryptosporangium aurantiacum TaxID=134849 RepID=A0A1M7PTX3_9ACTN|nr:ricin-type beta-trefoil lectin domain protein [Cryptosporangium aurantiacum]SHN20958.1 Ricin-type beta-trefoil lectin domain-containing protein [Cryptosporangium aurantiacum]